MVLLFKRGIIFTLFFTLPYIFSLAQPNVITSLPQDIYNHPLSFVYHVYSYNIPYYVGPAGNAGFYDITKDIVTCSVTIQPSTIVDCDSDSNENIYCTSGDIFMIIGKNCSNIKTYDMYPQIDIPKVYVYNDKIYFSLVGSCLNEVHVVYKENLTEVYKIGIELYTNAPGTYVCLVVCNNIVVDKYNPDILYEACTYNVYEGYTGYSFYVQAIFAINLSNSSVIWAKGIYPVVGPYDIQPSYVMVGKKYLYAIVFDVLAKSPIVIVLNKTDGKVVDVYRIVGNGKVYDIDFIPTNEEDTIILYYRIYTPEGPNPQLHVVKLIPYPHKVLYAAGVQLTKTAFIDRRNAAYIDGYYILSFHQASTYIIPETVFQYVYNNNVSISFVYNSTHNKTIMPASVSFVNATSDVVVADIPSCSQQATGDCYTTYEPAQMTFIPQNYTLYVRYNVKPLAVYYTYLNITINVTKYYYYSFISFGKEYTNTSLASIMFLYAFPINILNILSGDIVLLNINTKKLINEGYLSPDCTGLYITYYDPVDKREKISQFFLDTMTCNTEYTLIYVKIPDDYSYDTIKLFIYTGSLQNISFSYPYNVFEKFLDKNVYYPLKYPIYGPHIITLN